MSENIEIQTVTGTKANITSITDSPVTDPASATKVCESFIYYISKGCVFTYRGRFELGPVTLFIKWINL